MNDPGYEYWGLLADTWDLFRGDTSNWEDRFFYRRIIERFGQPVLDVGCGTGRLLLDFLSAGIDIDGVDVSPEMLALCREKAQELGLQPNLYQQEMEYLRLPRNYQTILVPSSSFQLVIDKNLARQALNSFYAHLHPGGVLVMPFMIEYRDGDPIDRGWSLTGEQIRPKDSVMVRRWSRTRFDLVNQLEYPEERFELILNGEIITEEYHQRTPGVRWYTQQQAKALFQDTGFIDLQRYKGFTEEPATESDHIFSLIGFRP